MGIHNLYGDVVRRHTKAPHNWEDLSNNADIEVENPNCGDDLQLRIEMFEDGIIKEVYFDGHACSLTIASASIMTSVVAGMSVPDALEMGKKLNLLLKGEKVWGLPPDMESFEIVPKTAAARIKCVSLPWDALKSLLLMLYGEKL